MILKLFEVTIALENVEKSLCFLFLRG